MKVGKWRGSRGPAVATKCSSAVGSAGARLAIPAGRRGTSSVNAFQSCRQLRTQAQKAWGRACDTASAPDNGFDGVGRDGLHQRKRPIEVIILPETVRTSIG